MNSDRAQTFPERMNVLIDRVGGPIALARKAGLSRRVIDKYRTGESEPSRSRLVALAEAGDVSVAWLATGEGSMILGEAPAAEVRKGLAEDQAPFVHISGLNGDFVLVPRYDVEASAGHGAFADREQVVDYMAFREDWVRRTLRVEPDNLVLITAVGDSMEPTIRAGDLMLIDTGVARIQDDAIYVLVKRGELIVKRVQQFFNGTVAIKSDNDAYEEETIPPAGVDDVRVAGRVRWVGRLY